jgi:predicted dehydrogenase
VREPSAYGSRGSYSSSGIDVQAQAILAGRRPVDDPQSWGYEAEDRTQFAAAARGEVEQPVPAAKGVRTVEALDAARLSALEGRSIRLG